MANSSDTFLWVNNTSHSIALREPENARKQLATIQRHVQKKSARRKAGRESRELERGRHSQVMPDPRISPIVIPTQHPSPANALTSRDQLLMHCYMVCLPPRLQGIRPDAIFSGHKVAATIGISKTNIVQDWIIICVQEYFGFAQMQEYVKSIKCEEPLEPTELVRARAYRKINDMLNDPCFNYQQVFLAVLYAHVADYDRHPRRLQSLHVKALKTLVDRNGGLRSFLMDGFIPPLYLISAHIFGGDAMLSETEVAMTKRRFDNVMQRLSAWARHRQGSKVFNTYGASQKRVLDFVEKVLIVPAAIYGEEACRFMLLFDIALTLMNLEDNQSQCIAYLEEFLTIIENSFCDPQDDLPPIVAGTLFAMSSHAREEVQRQFDVDRLIHKQYQFTVAEIDSTVIFWLLKPEARKGLTAHMRTILFDSWR